MVLCSHSNVFHKEGVRKVLAGFFSQDGLAFGFRWLHILVGIMWIGHLYYFNFTQIPNMPKIPSRWTFSNPARPPGPPL